MTPTELVFGVALGVGVGILLGRMLNHFATKIVGMWLRLRLRF